MSTPAVCDPAPRVDPRLLRELHVVDLRQGTRLLTFLALYAVAALVACRLAAAFPGSVGWRLAALPLYLLAAASARHQPLHPRGGSRDAQPPPFLECARRCVVCPARAPEFLRVPRAAPAPPRSPRRGGRPGPLPQLHALELAGFPDELGAAARGLPGLHHRDPRAGFSAGQRA